MQFFVVLSVETYSKGGQEMSYRMDGRTVEQFAQDIETGTSREHLAITLFKNYLKREHGFTGDITENGVDMQGGFIKDDAQVSCAADYLIGENQLPLEVKTSPDNNRFIYLKERQVKSYIKQGACVLRVSAIESDTPVFTFWTPEDLIEITKTCPKIHPKSTNGGKLSYVIDAQEQEWLTFKGRSIKFENLPSGTNRKHEIGQGRGRKNTRSKSRVS
jgi:hypothetical protein